MKNCFLSMFMIAFAYGSTITPIYISGPDSNRIILAFIGDGFNVTNQSRFDQTIAHIVDSIQKYEPWKTYNKFYNIYKISTISPDSGISIPSRDYHVNTTFNTSIIGKTLTTYTTTYSQVRDSLSYHLPLWDEWSEKQFGFLIINETFGAGSTMGADLAVIDMYPYPYPEQHLAMLHELGHLFGKLADEYTTSGGIADSDIEPNVSFDSSRATVKWRAWIKPTTHIPTTWLLDIGIWEGAKYQEKGIFKPEDGCMMATAANHFCRVCTEAIVKRIHSKLKMYDNVTPPPQVSFSNQPIPFSLQMIDTTNLKYSVKWYLDGIEIPSASGFSYVLDPATSGLGTIAHKLKCRFRDTTWYTYVNFGSEPVDTCPFVRTDPDSVMTDSVVWNLQYDIAVENTHFALPPSTFSVAVAPSGVRITANPYGTYQIAIYDLRGRLLSTLAGGTTYRPIEQTYLPKANGLIIVRMVTPKGVHAAKAVWVK